MLRPEKAKMDVNLLKEERKPEKKEEFLGEKTTISTSDRMSHYEQPMKDYFCLLEGFAKFTTITMALRMNIFEIIENICDQEGKKPSFKEIKSRLNFQGDMRHLMDFLDQLYFQGFLTREGVMDNAVYHNSEYTQQFFSKKGKENYSYIYLNFFRYARKLESSLDKMIPSGKAINYVDDIYTSNEDALGYWNYFYKSNELNFDYLFSHFDLSKFKKVLDIHGGNGLLSMKIKQAFPSTEVISFENPKMTDQANDFLKQNSMSENILLQFGDVCSDSFPEADCIIMPHVLLQYSCDNKKKILDTAFKSLRSGGQLIILEHLIDDNREKCNLGLIMSSMLGILGYEAAGHSFEEYRQCLDHQGFKNIQLMKPEKQGICEFIIAKKEGEGKM